MHIEVYLEEESAEAALTNLLPRIMPADWTAAPYVFHGRNDLLRRLRPHLRKYLHWPEGDWRVVVLVDRDSDDCLELKVRLDDIAEAAGLVPKSRAEGRCFHVLNRIAIEELEAWFFGDVEALRAAYPAVPETLAERAFYRDPDAIEGGTAEALARVLGFPLDRLPKIAVARAVSKHMDPERNRSCSFQVFRSGIADLVAEDA